MTAQNQPATGRAGARATVRQLTDRCAELDLRLKGDSAAVEVAAYLATLASHYRLTGRFKGP